jgi:hypothetical protein
VPQQNVHQKFMSLQHSIVIMCEHSSVAALCQQDTPHHALCECSCQYQPQYTALIPASADLCRPELPCNQFPLCFGPLCDSRLPPSSTADFLIPLHCLDLSWPRPLRHSLPLHCLAYSCHNSDPSSTL